MTKKSKAKKKNMAREDKIRFLETSIKSLEGARSKFIMNLQYGKSDIPQIEETIAKLQEELKQLKNGEKGGRTAFMYKLINWNFVPHKDAYYARGIVIGHYRLTDGTYILTSKVRSVSVDEEKTCFLVHTESGSHYRLSFADIDFDEMENTRVILQKLEVAADFWERCEKLCTSLEAERVAELERMLNLNELFLEVYGARARWAYFKDGSGIVNKIQIMELLGMFQGEVVVTSRCGGLVDFRYCSNGCIEPYHWSDGLRAVKVKNSSRGNIIFSGSRRAIVCQSGEITVIESGE